MSNRVSVSVGPFTATWEVGDPHIDVEISGSSNPVHTLSTNGDLHDDGMPRDGRSAERYVIDELTSFVEDDGDAYLANC